MDKRILATSDVHGELDKFNNLLNVVNYNPTNDLLVVCGDSCDRGPKVVETLFKMRELKEQGAIILKGNHDALAQETLEELLEGRFSRLRSIHIQCNGENTYNEFKELDRNTLIDLYEFIADMPLAYAIDNYIFVHAGVNASVPLKQNSEEDLLWIREEFIYEKAYDGKIVIFGHTPTYYMQPVGARLDNTIEMKIWHDPRYKDKIGIDCGAVFSGKLACLELPTLKEYYV